jgi:hypothetical protein
VEQNIKVRLLIVEVLISIVMMVMVEEAEEDTMEAVVVQVFMLLMEAEVAVLHIKRNVSLVQSR